MGATRKKKSTTIPSEASDDAANGGAVRPDEMPPDVLEFVTAIDDYKRKQRRPFPTWSEVLEVLKSLGYERSSR
jgi:hypothetical protein